MPKRNQRLDQKRTRRTDARSQSGISKSYMRSLLKEAVGKKLDNVSNRVEKLENRVATENAEDLELKARIEAMTLRMESLGRHAEMEEQMHRPNALGFAVFLLSIVVVVLFYLIILLPLLQTTLILITGFVLGFIISNVITEKMMLPAWQRQKPTLKAAPSVATETARRMGR